MYKGYIYIHVFGDVSIGGILNFVCGLTLSASPYTACRLTMAYGEL